MNQRTCAIWTRQRDRVGLIPRSTLATVSESRLNTGVEERGIVDPGRRNDARRGFPQILIVLLLLLLLGMNMSKNKCAYLAGGGDASLSRAGRCAFGCPMRGD